MNKFKNYGLWVAIFAFIPVLLEALGMDILPQNYEEVIKGLLGILVLAGIISNPKEGKGFIDTKNIK